jgi:predicted DNA-binding protein
VTTKKRSVYPLNIPPELEEKLVEASRRTGLSKADLMRLCMAVGLEDLRAVNYDLARVVADAARERRSVNYRDTVEAPALRVADEPAKKERNGTE